MNKNFSKVVCDAAKLDALMYAIESAYVGLNFGDDRELADRAEHAFYALWDIVQMLQQDLNEFEMDLKGVDIDCSEK